MTRDAMIFDRMQLAYMDDQLFWLPPSWKMPGIHNATGLNELNWRNT